MSEIAFSVQGEVSATLIKRDGRDRLVGVKEGAHEARKEYLEFHLDDEVSICFI